MAFLWGKWLLYTENTVIFVFVAVIVDWQTRLQFDYQHPQNMEDIQFCHLITTSEIVDWDINLLARTW